MKKKPGPRKGSPGPARHYADTPTRSIPWLLTEIGIGRQTLTRYLEGVAPDKIIAGKRRLHEYKLLTVFAAVVAAERRAHTRAGATTTDGDEEINRMHQEARLTRAKADLAEMKAAVERGEFLRREIMLQALSNLTAQLRAIIDAMPMQLKRAAPWLKSSEIGVIKRSADKILQACADVRIER